MKDRQVGDNLITTMAFAKYNVSYLLFNVSYLLKVIWQIQKKPVNICS